MTGVPGETLFLERLVLDPVRARSLRLNFEFNVESYCRQFGRRMDELIVERRAGARRISLDDVNARPPAIKLRDGIARLFAPLL